MTVLAAGHHYDSCAVIRTVFSFFSLSCFVLHFDVYILLPGNIMQNVIIFIAALQNVIHGTLQVHTVLVVIQFFLLVK